MRGISKLFVRISVICIAIYLIVCYFFAYAFGLDLWHDTYVIALEVCVCLFMSSKGKYYCRYMRWTAYGITFADIITSLEDLFDIMPTTIAVFVPMILISASLLLTTTLSIKHYIRVKKLKKEWKTNHGNQSHQSSKKSEEYSQTASDESTTTNATKTTHTA